MAGSRVIFFVAEVKEAGGPFPVGIVALHCKAWTKAFKEGTKFMVPALSPPGCSLITAERSLARPMFLKDLNRLLTFISTVRRPTDLPARDGEPMTSYSFRRTAPTLATTTNLLLHEYLPFGSWQGGALEKRKERRPRARNGLPLC